MAVSGPPIPFPRIVETKIVVVPPFLLCLNQSCFWGWLPVFFSSPARPRVPALPGRSPRGGGPPRAWGPPARTSLSHRPWPPGPPENWWDGNSASRKARHDRDPLFPVKVLLPRFVFVQKKTRWWPKPITSTITCPVPPRNPKPALEVPRAKGAPRCPVKWAFQFSPPPVAFPHHSYRGVRPRVRRPLFPPTLSQDTSVHFLRRVTLLLPSLSAREKNLAFGAAAKSSPAASGSSPPPGPLFVEVGGGSRAPFSKTRTQRVPSPPS